MPVSRSRNDKGRILAGIKESQKRSRFKRIREQGYEPGKTVIRYSMKKKGVLQRITPDGYLLIEGAGEENFSPFTVWSVVV